MDRNKVGLKSKSIKSSGITKKMPNALFEFIWNGIEADATEVRLVIDCNEAGAVRSIIVQDNGTGIKHEKLPDTFGTFLASEKNQIATQIKTQINKGKGRFSFLSFATEARWSTAYEHDGNFYKYEITIDNVDSDYYVATKPVLSSNKHTGTTVTFYNVQQLFDFNLSYTALEKELLEEFACYLYIFRKKDIKVYVDNVELDYMQYINQDLSEDYTITLGGYDFAISLIVWNETIKENFYIYYTYQNSIKHKDTTSYNRNAANFNHSIFVDSSYFESYSFAKPEYGDQVGINEEYDSKPFKLLQNELSEILAAKFKKHLQLQADSYVGRLQKKKSFPAFSNDVYGEMRKRDLVSVTKEFYVAEPRIFHKLNDVQEKSLLGFLNLLLSSEERENILTIVDSIVQLTPEQRQEFVDVLQKTKLENILSTIKMVEDRFKVIEELKKLVYSLTSFATERDHVQKIIEQHFWLFGEQYNFVSADVTMQKSLELYQKHLEIPASDANDMSEEDKRRRMDIFLCTSRKVEDSTEQDLEENVVIELKAPSVVLTKTVLRQIEDYMDIITNENQFNSSLRKWKFIAVCTEIDKLVSESYKSFEMYGKKCLANKKGNYEIYAMTWDDVFQSFLLRHNFILNKLNCDKDAIAQEIEKSIGDELSRDAADRITKDILDVV